MELKNQKGQWGSKFGFLMAAVGSAVGLGNLWGFPYKMGMSGGFAFFIIYIILVIKRCGVSRCDGIPFRTLSDNAIQNTSSANQIGRAHV